jgi:hypothetical protein
MQHLLLSYGWRHMDSIENFPVWVYSRQANSGEATHKLSLNEMPAYIHGNATLVYYAHLVNGGVQRGHRLTWVTDNSCSRNETFNKSTGVAKLTIIYQFIKTVMCGIELFNLFYSREALCFPHFFMGKFLKSNVNYFHIILDYVEKKGYCREWMLCRNWCRNTLSGLSLC